MLREIPHPTPTGTQVQNNRVGGDGPEAKRKVACSFYVEPMEGSLRKPEQCLRGDGRVCSQSVDRK